MHNRIQPIPIKPSASVCSRAPPFVVFGKYNWIISKIFANAICANYSNRIRSFASRLNQMGWSAASSASICCVFGSSGADYVYIYADIMRRFARRVCLSSIWNATQTPIPQQCQLASFALRAEELGLRGRFLFMEVIKVRTFLNWIFNYVNV